MAKINGKIVSYDACSEEGADAYSSEHFNYIGSGTIYSIDGVEQTFTQKHYFFTRKDK